jgi:hypothetical protein
LPPFSSEYAVQKVPTVLIKFFVQGDHMEVAKILLEAGASIRIPNKYGLTALEAAETLNRKAYSRFRFLA